MALFKLIATALGIFKAVFQWFRDRSIHDAGAKAERLRVIEAGNKADEKMRKVDPIKPVDITDKLRGAGEF